MKKVQKWFLERQLKKKKKKRKGKVYEKGEKRSKKKKKKKKKKTKKKKIYDFKIVSTVQKNIRINHSKFICKKKKKKNLL